MSDKTQPITERHLAVVHDRMKSAEARLSQAETDSRLLREVVEAAMRWQEAEDPAAFGDHIGFMDVIDGLTNAVTKYRVSASPYHRKRHDT